MPETVETLMSRPDVKTGSHPRVGYDASLWPSREKLAKQKRKEEQWIEDMAHEFRAYQVPQLSTVLGGPRWLLKALSYLPACQLRAVSQETDLFLGALMRHKRES
jgi:hypothetical protein